LYPVLHEAGFASQARAVSRDDGMKLKGMWISAVVRCAPPANKPAPDELRACASWLDEEIGLLRNLRVVVCLGGIAFDGFLNHRLRTGKLATRTGFEFGHAAEYALSGGPLLLASYHPSLQNTNTGKLTRGMFLAVFKRAWEAAGLK
jgi:uracil-DNA glycosylase family 4